MGKNAQYVKLVSKILLAMVICFGDKQVLSGFSKEMKHYWKNLNTAIFCS